MGRTSPDIDGRAARVGAALLEALGTSTEAIATPLWMALDAEAGDSAVTTRSNRSHGLGAEARGPHACAAAVVSVSENDLEALEERAAIMEYDGGLSREEAERAAVENVRPVVELTAVSSSGRTARGPQELSADSGSIVADDPRLDPFLDALAALLWADIRRSHATTRPQISPTDLDRPTHAKARTP